MSDQKGRRRERQATRPLVLRGLSGKRAPSNVDAKALVDGPTDQFEKEHPIWTAAFGANIFLLVEENGVHPFRWTVDR
jgi:hypothetical protein